MKVMKSIPFLDARNNIYLYTWHLGWSEYRHAYFGTVPQFFPELPSTFRPHCVLRGIEEHNGRGVVAADLLLGGG